MGAADANRQVILLTGPAGAGKTATAHAWAARRSASVHISLDDVRDWVVGGYADPQDGWTPEASAQYALARLICADAARRHIAANREVIVDDAVFPNWPEVGREPWEEALGSRVHLVALLPTTVELLRRNRLRAGHRRLTDRAVREIAERMHPWATLADLAIDNSSLSAVETAGLLRAEVRARGA